MPWNFPFFLIARKAGPALIKGNTRAIKPYEETPHNTVNSGLYEFLPTHVVYMQHNS